MYAAERDNVCNGDCGNTSCTLAAPIDYPMPNTIIRFVVESASWLASSAKSYLGVTVGLPPWNRFLWYQEGDHGVFVRREEIFLASRTTATRSNLIVSNVFIH
jgi:hypothetical protein